MRPAPSFSLRPRPVAFVSLFALMPLLTGCNWLSGQHANRMGMVYYRFGNYTAAAHEFRRATIDDPNNADHFHNLAAARARQADLAAAERNYRTALQRNPGHQPSYHGLAALLHRQNRTGEALALLQSWTDIEPYRAEPFIELAWLQRETGDVNGAKHTLHRALQSSPRHPTVLAHLGQIYQDTGQHATAAAMYQRSLYSHWYQPRVHSRLAMLRNRSRMSRMNRRAGSQPVVAGVPAANAMMVPGPGRRATATPVFNADPAHVPAQTADNTRKETTGNGKPQ